MGWRADLVIEDIAREVEESAMSVAVPGSAGLGVFVEGAFTHQQRKMMKFEATRQMYGPNPSGSAWDWNPAKHPRNRVGKFRGVLHGMSRMWGDVAVLPDGVIVEKSLAGGYIVHHADGKKKTRTLTAGHAAKVALGE